MSLKSSALFIEKCIHKASRTFSWVSVLVLGVMMVFISADVISRYIFKNPITGSIDFVVVMMVLLVFPAFAHVTHLNQHVRTDIIFDALSERKQGIIDIINSLCSIFIVGLVTWQLGKRVIKIIHNPPGITTDYFEWPHMPFLIIATLGFGLMTLELIIWLFRSIKKAKHG